MSEEPEPSSNTDDNVLIGNASVEEFVQEGFKKVVNGTKTSNKLPCGKARDIYETCPSFHRIMRAQGDAVLEQLTRLMRHSGCKGNIKSRDNEERLEMVIAANDSIFEKVGFILDDIAGIRRNPDPEFLARSTKPISGSWNKRTLAYRAASSSVKSAVNTMLSTSKTTEKSQLNFKDKIDNSRDTPFIPKINYKHNLLKPLALLFEDSDGVGQYCHPYEFELEKLTPDVNDLTSKPPQMYLPLSETPFLYVKTVQDVDNMLNDLRQADIIAVDLEHHSFRSFQGFTCLLQISTRNKDFIVDTLELRNDLQPLNEVFTNPKILKVFHGALNDIQWLQRDLAIYVVNMFDTHIAARYLGYPALSLAYLLDKFCDVKALKEFQLADWRIRPMLDEMIQYAREDTHYLLYIFDKMRNELLEKANGLDNLLRVVFSESNQLCLTRYVKPTWHPDDHLQLYHKSKRLFDNRQLFALKQLYDWRDKIARECDESTGYVLPNHMLLHIAEILPREVQGILACCNPVPLLVRQNLTPIHLMIRKAQEQPLVRPIIDQTHQIDRAETYGISVDSPLRCPHDLTWLPEFRPDLPVILSSPVEYDFDPKLVCNKPKITIFENSSGSIKVKKDSTVLTPYQRYKMVKPFADNLLQKEKTPDEENEKKEQKEEKIEAVKKEHVEIEDMVPLRKQLKKKERKRKSEEIPLEETKKKKKKKTTPRLLPNPFASAAPEPVSVPPEVPPKEKKKKKKKGANKQGLKNFDYASVNYNQFQTNSAQSVVHKPAHVKNKHKKTGKKKFKIAI